MLDKKKVIIYKKMIDELGELCVKINGDCMFPLINDSEIVKVLKIKKKVCIGDIVMVYVDGSFKIHRILKINYSNKTIITKGDNSVKLDGKSKIDDVIGIVLRRKDYSMTCQILIFIVSIISRNVSLIFKKLIECLKFIMKMLIVTC